jgi:hypothetical protein
LITATVGDVEFIIYDGHLLRLITYTDRVHLFEAEGVDLIDTAQRTGTGFVDGTHIRGDVGILTLERDVPAVGNVDFSDPDGILRTSHFHFVGAVDDKPKARAIDADVVSHIA